MDVSTLLYQQQQQQQQQQQEEDEEEGEEGEKRSISIKYINTYPYLPKSRKMYKPLTQVMIPYLNPGVIYITGV